MSRLSQVSNEIDNQRQKLRNKDLDFDDKDAKDLNLPGADSRIKGKSKSKRNKFSKDKSNQKV